MPPLNDNLFYFETLISRDMMSTEYINHIFQESPKTLRLIVSLGSQFFDTIGIANALTAKTRHTMTQAMAVSEGNWEFQVDEQLWLFFLLQVVEPCKVSLLKFKRFPINCTSSEGGATLLVLIDASLTLILYCFIIHPNQDEGNKVSFLTHKCFLASEITTIPKRELQAQTMGSAIIVKLVSEMGHLISDFMLAGDS